jgi:chromosome segregation ATPase
MEKIRIVPNKYDITMSKEDYHKLIEKLDSIYSVEQKIKSLNEIIEQKDKLIQKYEQQIESMRNDKLAFLEKEVYELKNNFSEIKEQLNKIVKQ